MDLSPINYSVTSSDGDDTKHKIYEIRSESR